MTTDDVLLMARCRALTADGTAKTIREGARLSIGDMARACGVDQGTLSRWERGLRRPRSPSALRYLAVLEALKAQSVEHAGEVA